MGIGKVYNRIRNTKIIGNTKKTWLILVLAFPLVGCNSVTLSQNAKHYQTRAVQIMHVTRDVQFGDENNTYFKLYKHWREENALERQRAYYQKCLMNLQAQNPGQRLSPGRANSPVGVSQPPARRSSPQRFTGNANIQEWGVPTSESALPVGSL